VVDPHPATLFSYPQPHRCPPTAPDDPASGPWAPPIPPPPGPG
jgi:hypothetical protein